MHDWLIPVSMRAIDWDELVAWLKFLDRCWLQYVQEHAAPNGDL